MPRSRLKLLLWSTDTERVNPLVYFFFVSSIGYSLGYLFLESASQSSLFQDMVALYSFIPYAWGAVLAFAVIFALLNMMYRRQYIGQTVTILGFMCWVFAGFMWLIGGNPTVLFGVAIPNMLFWAYFYFQVVFYHKHVKEGIIPDDAEMVAIMREKDRLNAGPSEPPSVVLDPSRLPPVWPGDTDK